MPPTNALGAYLRARRELVDPTDAAIRVMGVRRTSGRRREKLAIGDSDGQLLALYHAEPGSETARTLALLGSLSASGDVPTDR